MPAVVASQTFGADDPLTRAIAPSSNESPAERSTREQLEAAAKLTSDKIDEYLRSFSKPAKSVKILLLGQSESGKSTTLKNFKIMFNKDGFLQERASWKAIIHLNLLRHVIKILKLLEAVELELSQRLLETSSEVEAQLTTYHRTLRLQLSPLIEVESNLSARLTTSSPPASPRSNAREICVYSSNPWSLQHAVASSSGESSPTNGNIVSLRSELDAGLVLHACKEDIQKLWRDSVVRDLLLERQMRLDHEAGFFLDDVERITDPSYIPTDLDICKARLKTMGVTETVFQIKKGFTGIGEWRVYDVGGSRTQRASWIPYFDDVNAILFLAPISPFDQKLEEEPTINRIEDSLTIWREICKNKLLWNVDLILFLNKVDLLRRKLESGINIQKYLPRYKGSANVEEFCKYFERKFSAIYKDSLKEREKEAPQGLLAKKETKSRRLCIHFTSVIDHDKTRMVITDVQDFILGNNMTTAYIL